MEVLKKGSKGKAVGNWQKFLNKYFTPDTDYENLNIDNDFGSKTERNTKGYQYYKGLIADGIVGKNTIAQAIKDGFKPMENTIKITRPINEIIVHITANGNGLIGEALRAYIDKLHRGNGWSEIGYHYIIDKLGNVIIGRDINKVGSHCKNHNTGTIGIAYDSRGADNDPNGKYGKYFQSREQKEAFERLIKEKMTELNINKVTGHNKYDSGKACPCFDSNSAEFKNAIGL